MRYSNWSVRRIICLPVSWWATSGRPGVAGISLHSGGPPNAHPSRKNPDNESRQAVISAARKIVYIYRNGMASQGQRRCGDASSACKAAEYAAKVLRTGADTLKSGHKQRKKAHERHHCAYRG